jgi:hypothetical protein
LADVADCPDAGVVHQNIKAAQLLDDLGDRGVDRWGIRDIAVQGQHAIRRAVGAAVKDGQAGTPLLQQARGRRPNPTGAAGDDGDEALEVSHVGVLSAEQWIDVDLGPRACRLRPFTGEHGADLLEADGGGDKRPGIDGTACVRRDGGVEPRRA